MEETVHDSSGIEEAKANKIKSIPLRLGALLNRALVWACLESLCPLTQQCTFAGIYFRELVGHMAEMYVQGQFLRPCLP
jgi:hypothetical protein